ncbi:MAG: metallophosphoesterase family protein [Pseudomonadota bacterium]
MGLRIALLSDTHGDLDPRVAAVVAGCDYALHAGDVGAAAVLHALQPRRRVIAVRGNNDTPANWPADEALLLAALPEEAVLELPGGRVAVIHGHQAGEPARRHDYLRARFPEARLVLYGHSHRRLMDQSRTPWVVNPGAAGRSRTYGGPSLVILAAEAENWRVEELCFTGLPPRV